MRAHQWEPGEGHVPQAHIPPHQQWLIAAEVLLAVLPDLQSALGVACGPA